MSKTTKTRRVSTRVELELDAKEIGLIKAVRRAAGAPKSATVRLYVSVPGGGDWSNEDLNLGDMHPLRAEVTWETYE
jgi:hypothetical protein